MELRLLNADEIECRVARVSPKAVQLLLYKDARCDQNILDEFVGPLNWQKEYQLINGSIACTISIWDNDKGRWISKQDVGNESNMEAVKGAFSDAQKRAAFAWGIGRELYTSPDMYFPISKTNASGGKCYDHFVIESIKYVGKRIEEVSIKNTDTDCSMTFTHKGQVQASTKIESKERKTKTEEINFRANFIKSIGDWSDEGKAKVAEKYGVKSIVDMTTEQMKEFMDLMEDKKHE